MAPLKANLSIRRNNEPVHKSGRSSTSLLHSNGVNLINTKQMGLFWRGREFSVVYNNEIHSILSPSTPKCWLISRKRSRGGIPRNKLKPEPCSLYHRIESTVDQQHLVSVKHSGLSLRQSEVNALRQSCTILHPQSLPFLLGRA